MTLEPAALGSRVKHSTTELPKKGLVQWVKLVLRKVMDQYLIPMDKLDMRTINIRAAA